MSTHENGQQAPSQPMIPAPAASPPTETMRTSIFLPPMFQTMDQGPQVPSALTAAPTAATLAKAFQRRWPIAIAAGLIFGALTVAAVMIVMPARYTTYYCAKVNANAAAGPLRDAGVEGEFSVFKAGQAAIAKQRTVITRALDMQVNGRFIKDLGIVRAAGDPVEWLQAALKTDFNKAPEIMTVTLSADQPEELTVLLNSLGKSFIEENRLQEKNKHSEQIENTQARAKQLEKDVNLKRKIYNERIRALGGQYVDKGRKLDQMEQELSQLRKSLRDKQTDVTNVKARLEQLARRQQSNDVPVPEVFINEILRQEPEADIYFKKIAGSNKDYDDALRVLQDPHHPQMLRYQQMKDAAQQALANYRRQRLPELTKKFREKEATEAALLERQLRDDLGAFEQQQEGIKNSIDQVETEIQRLRPQNLPPELIDIQNDIEASEKALNEASQKIQMWRLAEQALRVSILQDAIEPHSKDTSKQMKVAGAGSILMFLVGVLGVCFLEFRSRKITTSEEVKRGLGLTVIGTVPTLPDKARSPISQAKLDPYWQNQLMESIDTIRTMLLHSARSNNTRVIMVTSAVGGEGKTSLASQLAASMARAWKKTLLIDGDLRNPTSHKVFDVSQEPGLSEVLRGELPASEAVRSTPLSRLWVLPAGHWDSHAVQALAQDNVRTILEELKLQYDFIILDSCPILPVADSLLLGQNVDGVIMTVMRDVSRSPAVHAAHQRLESLGIKTLGAVVIGAKNELGPMGYKYAYQARPQQ